MKGVLVEEGSPQDTYLKSVGVYESDWGPEMKHADADAKHSPLTSISGSPSPRHFDRCTKPIPLKLTDERFRRRARFQALFAAAANPNLPKRENTQFLERFRYVICTSQLMDEDVSVSSFHRRRGHEPLFGDDGPWPAIGTFKQRGQYWIGGGGCVIVIALLLAWAIREYDTTTFGSVKGTVAFTLSLLVALFLFAHTRRQRIRMLRVRAITTISNLVEKCHMFDVAASRSILFIQEVELVARGYRITQPLSPITRLEKDTKTRRCQRMRDTLLSALQLAQSLHTRAGENMQHLTDRTDLHKLLDVYCLDEFEDRDDDEMNHEQSLVALKVLQAQTHRLRRRFLCCLMAIDFTGTRSEIRVWKEVVSQLKEEHDLIEQLAREMDRMISNDISGMKLDRFKLTTPTESCRKVRGLTTLSQSLRGIQARMHVFGEDTLRLLEVDSGQAGDPNLIETYDSIGADLQALVEEWHSGRSAIHQTLSRHDDAQDPEAGVEESEVQQRQGSKSFSDLDTLAAEPSSTLSWDSPRTDSTAVEVFPDSSFVYEGVSEKDTLLPASRISREERIRRRHFEMKQKSDAVAEARKKYDMMSELQGVLVKRSHNEV